MCYLNRRGGESGSLSRRGWAEFLFNPLASSVYRIGDFPVRQKNDTRTHVLISLCGTSPAVISETVFALAQAGDPPGKVVVITTLAGEACLRTALFESGVWSQLRKSLNCDISFSLNQEHLRLLPDGCGGDAPDVADTLSAESAGSFILDVLRQYTENPDTRITFSIAGGRKSMSALGALCMSLLGRHEDRLCHILVNPPFDDPGLKPGFYFPVPGRIHVDRNGNSWDSADARLTLSILPFVHCRYLIEREWRRLPGEYTRMVALADRAAEVFEEPSELRLYPGLLCVRAGKAEFSLQFQLFLLYWMLAERRREGREHLYHRKDLCEEFAVFVEHARERLPQRYWYACSDLLEVGRIREETLNKRISDLAAKLKKHHVPECFLPSRGEGNGSVRNFAHICF